MLELDSVDLSYGRRKILDGFSASFRPGIYGLLGPNGAGKTTLLRIMATDLRPDAGVVRIDGREVSTIGQARLARRSIGYLPQQTWSSTSYTVSSLVTYVAHLRGLNRATLASEVGEAISSVGLADRRSAKLSQLSGGMRQRAGLACALVGRPKIIILDEPTVGLDPAQRYEVKKILRTQEATIILSTHIVEDVAAVADTVMVMNEGRLLFEGQTAELAERAPADVPGDTPLERAYLALTGGARL